MIASAKCRPGAQPLRSCFKNVASAGRARRTAATKSSGTILNSVKLAPKGRALRMGRVTTGVYNGVHEDGEPLRNAAMTSAVVFKTASERDRRGASIAQRRYTLRGHHRMFWTRARIRRQRLAESSVVRRPRSSFRQGCSSEHPLGAQTFGSRTPGRARVCAARMPDPSRQGRLHGVPCGLGSAAPRAKAIKRPKR